MKKSFTIFLLTLLLVGCTKKYIPNSKIADNPTNRAIFDVVKSYHKALEDKNLKNLMGLVSKAYYEDNGTLKGEDDYGYSELSEKFSGLFGSVKALKLDLFLDKIQVDEREAKLNFSYEIKFRISYPTGDRWAVESDKDQMVLKLEEGNWKIASGL